MRRITTLVLTLFVLGCPTSHFEPVLDEPSTGPTRDAAAEPDPAPDATPPPTDSAPAAEDVPDHRECPPGVQRWCSDRIHDNGRQTCRDDGTWGGCIEPTITVEGLADRPNNECGCRYFYFNYECCEDQEDRDGDGLPDCWIPDDWEEPACESDGTLCSFCDTHAECGDPTDLCMIARDGYSFCGRDCGDEPCPTGYQCTEVHTRSDLVHQCTPVSMRCD